MMGRTALRRCGIVLVGGMGWGFGCQTPQDVAPPHLEELVPGFDWPAWFTDLTGLPTDPQRFGAYVAHPIDDALYLGFGANWPAAADGAAIGRYDQDGFGSIASLTEQGMLEMASVGDMLLVPGVDPCCGDEWQFGNFYTYRTATGLIKWRNLPNVIHAWGVWVDAWDQSIYLAASSHLGDFRTWTGEIWRTVDTGATWERVAARDEGVGEFRTYDVIGQRERLYAVRADTTPGCQLVVQPTLGTLWGNVLNDEAVACGPRLVEFGDFLLALDSSSAAVHSVPVHGTPSKVDLPFRVAAYSFHWATTAGQSLYAVSADGAIMITRDLEAWDIVASAAEEFLAIRHWPRTDQLVLTSRGDGGSVWTLQLCDGDPC